MNTSSIKKHNSVVNVRVDAHTKKRAQKTFENMGIDLSSGINLFLHTVVATQSIPFEVRTEDGYSLKREKEILRNIKEYSQEKKKGKTRSYTSTKEMMKDVLEHTDSEGKYV